LTAFMNALAVVQRPQSQPSTQTEYSPKRSAFDRRASFDRRGHQSTPAETSCAQTVEEAGCKFVGIQKGDPALHLPTLCLFIAEHGATLAIRVNEISVASIRLKVLASKARFENAGTSVSTVVKKENKLQSKENRQFILRGENGKYFRETYQGRAIWTLASLALTCYADRAVALKETLARHGVYVTIQEVSSSIDLTADLEKIAPRHTADIVTDILPTFRLSAGLYVLRSRDGFLAGHAKGVPSFTPLKSLARAIPHTEIHTWQIHLARLGYKTEFVGTSPRA